MFEEIKYFIQRGRKGYSDRDGWDLSEYWGEIMPELLRGLKGGVGCPCEFYDKENKNNECEKWNEALETMAQGFEAASWIQNKTLRELKKENGETKYTLDFKSIDNAKEKMDAGLKLFAENYLSLWD